MAYKGLMTALIIIGAASPISAAISVAQPETTAETAAPEAPPNALYCLRTEPITGTRLGTIACLTREEWAEGDVDVDKEWAADGVRVIV